MNWFGLLKARGELADRLAREMPVALRERCPSLTSLVRLHWAVREHARSIEAIRIDMIKAQALEELVLAAEALAAAFTEIADAVKGRIETFGTADRSIAA